MNTTMQDVAGNAMQTVDSACETMSCGLTQNVGDSERLLSIIGGGIIGVYGLRSGGLTGLAIAAIGGSLLCRGITGHCHMYGAIGMSSNREQDSATGVPAQAGFKYEESI